MTLTVTVSAGTNPLRPNIAYETDSAGFDADTRYRMFVVKSGWSYEPDLDASASSWNHTVDHLLDFLTWAAVTKYPSTYERDRWAPYSHWIVGGTAETITVPKDLKLGVSYEAVIVLRSDTDHFEWAHDTFTLSDTPETPTTLVPTAGSTVDTNLPIVGATRVASTTLAPVRLEFELATDAGFTTNVRTFTQPISAAGRSGPSTMTVPAESALVAGTWYLRARAVNGAGDTSSWSSSVSFTVSHPPTVANVTPAGGLAFRWEDAGYVASWSFRSTSPDQSQSAYQVEVQALDGTAVADTGKVTGTLPASSAIPIPIGYKAAPLRHRVRVWDLENTAGAYSDWATFSAHDPATIDVTGPTGTVTTPAPTVEWSVTPSTAGGQITYRVVVTDELSTTVFDTGVVTGTATSYELPITSGLQSGHTYTARVTITDVLGLEVSDAVSFATEWLPVATPTFTVEASTFDSAGPVTVLIDTAADLDPDFLAWRIYWRRAGATAWAQLGPDIDTSDAYVRVGLFEILPNVEQELAVVQVADRFGVSIESELDPATITPTGRAWWLIADTERIIGGETVDDVPISGVAARDSRRIVQIESDPHAPAIERAEIPIVGRGTKVELGTDFGITGTLTIVLTDDDDRTAIEQEAELVAMLTQVVTLRKPAGVIARVNPHDVSFDPQGVDDLVVVSLPYTEVAE